MVVLEEHFRARFLFLDKFKSLVKITVGWELGKELVGFYSIKKEGKIEKIPMAITILSILLLSVSAAFNFYYFSLLSSKTSVSVEESSKIFRHTFEWMECDGGFNFVEEDETLTVTVNVTAENSSKLPHSMGIAFDMRAHRLLKS